MTTIKQIFGFDEAVEYYEKGLPFSAIDQIVAHLKADLSVQNRAMAQAYHLMVLRSIGHYASAVEIGYKYLAESPDYSEVSMELAWALYACDKWSEAAGMATFSIRKFPEDHASVNKKRYFNDPLELLDLIDSDLKADRKMGGRK